MFKQAKTFVQKTIVAAAKLIPMTGYTVTALSKVDVLIELLRNSEVGGGAGDRVCFTRNGFVAGISIPGQLTSGAIYVYDIPTTMLFMVEIEGRSTDFTRSDIDRLVPQVMVLLDRQDNRNGHHNGHKHHHRNNSTRNAAAIKTNAPAVETVAA